MTANIFPFGHAYSLSRMFKGDEFVETNYISEMISLLLMAVALGMDAFSVSLGAGMQQLRLKRIALIGIVFGIFHILLPLIGMIVGQLISTKIGHMAVLAGGLLLIAIGMQMILTAFNHEIKKVIEPVGFGLLFLALSVSVDSFSVGIGLGMSDVKMMIALILFGGVSTCMTWLGFLLGRKMRGLLGVYSEILGGSILCTFGLVIIFG